MWQTKTLSKVVPSLQSLILPKNNFPNTVLVHKDTEQKNLCEQNIMFPFSLWEVENGNFLVEKPGKHHLHSMMKVNFSGDKSGWHISPDVM